MAKRKAAGPRLVDQRYEEAAIDEVREHPDNPRRGDVEAIEGSIDHNGFFGAILAQRSTGYVIAGNHRWKAAKAAGLETVPVLWLDVDKDEARRIMLADNKTNDAAGYDEAALASVLRELAVTPEGLAGTAYSEDELAQLLRTGAGGGGGFGSGDEDDDAVTLSAGIAELGDVWILGRHRVLCGDAATDLEQRDLLLAGAKPTVVYMDPPYGMHLATDYKKIHRDDPGSKWGTSNTFDPVIGDDAPFDAGPLIEAFADAREQLWWGADYYRDTIPIGGSWFVWDKRSHDGEAKFDNVIGNHFELCWSRQPHRRELLRHTWSGLHGVHGHGEEHRRLHPTQKPVALHLDLFEKVTKPGDVVLDLYGGSGSTLIACELAPGDLACVTAELVPAYVDVICRRWQMRTGQMPVLEATGEERDFTTTEEEDPDGQARATA